ncbi:hypothetical protein HDA40_000606 [Hamadaea flava]|uniref:Uncharacterized protein n=1 Tax=Hamadaea flava TaxID=1742688 RepID=A0ABV8LYP9_9ACTN|nr:hypothetical protein [Hamadaea flava]MCP2322099.1 hypothetical protein [Hamadaea flava]
MNDQRVKDEFDRIAVREQLGKDRRLIAQYEAGLAHARGKVEEARYKLGRLDERLERAR